MPASYSTGFAPRDFPALNPSLYKGLLFAWDPGLGPSGKTLVDWGGKKANGTLTNSTVDTAWQVRGPVGGYNLLGQGGTSYVDCGTQPLAYDTIAVSFWLSCPNWGASNYDFAISWGLTATAGIGFFRAGVGTQDWTASAMVFCGDGYNNARAPRAVMNTATSGFTADSWHQFYGELGPSTVNIAIDGVSQGLGGTSAAAAVPALASTAALNVLGSQSTSNYPACRIRSLHVWNRGLKQQERRILQNDPGALWAYQEDVQARKVTTNRRRRLLLCS
jgi:hypothetical protein